MSQKQHRFRMSWKRKWRTLVAVKVTGVVYINVFTLVFTLVLEWEEWGKIVGSLLVLHLSIKKVQLIVLFSS